MKILITMVGEGARFKRIGIGSPKHEIIAKDRSLFEWSMDSLEDFFDEEFIFIVREGLYSESFICGKCKELGIRKFKLIKTSKLTDGQASTVMLADGFVSDDEAICIYNIDTYVEKGSILKDQLSSDYSGFIHVFKADGDKWSFVKVNESNSVVEIAEKRRISDLATIGFYYFSSWDLFKKCYCMEGNKVKLDMGEIYVAPLYMYLLNNNLKVGISDISSDRVHILGTPEDLYQFDKDWRWRNL